MASSVVPLRPLGTTELLDASVRAVWAQRRAVFPIAVPIAAVITVVGSLLQYAALRHTDTAVVTDVTSLLLKSFAAVLLAGLVAPAISATMVGGRPGAGACLRAVGVRAVGLAALAAVVLIGEGVGLVLLLVGGVWLWGVWAVAGPALALERIGPVAALRRSFRLVRGDFWRVWGTRALGYLVTTVIGTVVSVPFELIAVAVARVHSFAQADQSVGRPGAYVLIVSVGALIGAVITAPITASIDTLLYADLRMRREGMDIVMGLPPLPDRYAAATW